MPPTSLDILYGQSSNGVGSFNRTYDGPFILAHVCEAEICLIPAGCKCEI